jgi:hypothetical protein
VGDRGRNVNSIFYSPNVSTPSTRSTNIPEILVYIGDRMSRKSVNKAISDGIWEEYAPRIGVIEAVEATETTKEIKGNPGKINPQALYVGPILDGWVEYMPEIARLVRRNDNDNPLPDRHRMKRLVADIVDPVTHRRASAGRGEDVAGYGFAMVEFKRGSKWIRLGSQLLHNEPGEILNSLEVEYDPETNEPMVVSPVRSSDGVMVKSKPQIRLDRVNNLHYMLVGDEWRIQFEALGRKRTLLFNLRDKSEGSSLVDAI